MVAQFDNNIVNSAMTMLTVQDLTMPGLDRVAFALEAGDCIAVMGPSGAGKTRLLRAIADLDPNSGSVSADGHDRAAETGPRWRSMVMYVAGEPAWWTERVRDHFPDDSDLPDLVRQFGLSPECLDWGVDRLSSGERQRLGLARAVIRSPKILLLDEPTSSLDPDAEQTVEAVLAEQLDAGTSIVLATHAAEQARRFARRCLRVEGGSVREVAL